MDMFGQTVKTFTTDPDDKQPKEAAPTGKVGTVKFFSAVKGYGFISPDGGGKDVFVHITAVERAGWSTLKEGQRVRYDTQSDAHGTKAINLRAE